MISSSIHTAPYRAKRHFLQTRTDISTKSRCLPDMTAKGSLALAQQTASTYGVCLRRRRHRGTPVAFHFSDCQKHPEAMAKVTLAAFPQDGSGR
jgi:hypothetical protein